ncbi:hypothetical protein TeGR_g6650 [Tetraparma gracilis]|uniref:Uncharacterized protein n=1 Tax=Tetraparma gracilis TaxID=2962635 RepID=A0ABQ6M855_9STRA|nr:hypothetical protein TeGR_g6650 [Tetraparma gracilis]
MTPKSSSSSSSSSTMTPKTPKTHWAVSCPANIVTIPDENYTTDCDTMYFICTDTFESEEGIRMNIENAVIPFVAVDSWQDEPSGVVTSILRIRQGATYETATSNPVTEWYGAYSAPNHAQFRLGSTIIPDADMRFPYLNCNMGDYSSLPNGYDAYCTGVFPSDEEFNGNNMVTMGLVKVDKDGSYECPCGVPVLVK